MMNYVAQKQKIVDEEHRKEKRVFIRMYVILGLCFSGFAVVSARAAYLHLVDNKMLSWIANKQYTARIPLSLRRGKIYDRNGSELAVSLPVPSLYADPELVSDPEKTAEKLSAVLGIREGEILPKLKAPRRFVWIKRRISYETLKDVKALDLPGINYVEESRRFYPNGELASQVLGAVGYDSQALAGLEMAYDTALISRKKTTYYQRDAIGRLYEAPIGFAEQTDVGEIYLTIDKQIQFITENALRRTVKEFNASDGVALVMDPNSGDILAMANASSFDPNRYSKYPADRWRNRTVTDTFEPGSTFKVFIVAAALESGVVSPDTVYNCGNGLIRIGGHTLKDHHPYADLPVQDIIKYSSNIGALKIAFDMEKEQLYKVLKRFGVGEDTGIDFPGEVNGTLRDYKTWREVEQATIAFGQGLALTPLQMTVAFSAAISGTLYKPRLVARIVDQGKGVTRFEPEVLSHPVRPDTADTLRLMLKRAVEEGGTGFKASSGSYLIGGKTGTAQKVVAGMSGYAKGKYFSSFLGFAPVNDPNLVVFMGIDEPKGANYYGGTVTAPAVKEIIERSLTYLGLPSSRSKVLRTAENITYIKTDVDLEGMGKARFVEMGDGRYVMPDLTGLTLRQVFASTGEVQVEASVEGSGVTIMQDPQPGSVIKRGSKFSIRLAMPR